MRVFEVIFNHAIKLFCVCEFIYTFVVTVLEIDGFDIIICKQCYRLQIHVKHARGKTKNLTAYFYRR